MYQKAFLQGLLLLLVLSSRAQLCTNPGQTPVTAVLVCGSATLNVSTPSFCGQNTVPVPCGDGFNYRDINPNFFRMECYSAGTLGFSILPDAPNANYNWHPFDITNTNPVDIFTNPSLFVACNWSGDVGETGASSDGTDLVVCSGLQPLFSKMPNLLRGHTYMLMVSNQSGSTGSYQLTFEGGSAVITDPVEPQLFNARASCDGMRIYVRTNKQMQCNTMAPDGSDFTLSGGATIIAAFPGSCGLAYSSDSVILLLNQPLANGNYTLMVQNGSDGNTMIDACGRSILEGDSTNFTVVPLQPTLMDSIKPVGCAPSYIDLVFKKPIRCNSIANDGSDFIFSGPQTISVSFPQSGCDNISTLTVIRLKLSPAFPASGTYQVQLTTGSDGNTLIDECGLATPPGATLSFTVKEAVSAQFNYFIPPSCRESNVSFFHDGGHDVSSWRWSFGNGAGSAEQNPSYTFIAPGNHKVQLIVSNGECTDTATSTIVTAGYLTASFEVPSLVCPGDTMHFVNKSSGNIDSWSWSFGNGSNSSQKTPVGHRYIETGRETYYTITLVAANSTLHCGDTTHRVVKVLGNCFIAVPSAFTPNGDGKNDFLGPLNALKADQLQFRVYNRQGQLIFETSDWTRKWDGTIHGVPQPTGIYAWLLSYVHHDTGDRVFLKGTTVLLR